MDNFEAWFWFGRIPKLVFHYFEVRLVHSTSTIEHAFVLYIKVLLQIMQEHENVEKTRIPTYLVQNKWFSFRALKANMNLKGTLRPPPLTPWVVRSSSTPTKFCKRSRGPPICSMSDIFGHSQWSWNHC